MNYLTGPCTWWQPFNQQCYVYPPNVNIGINPNCSSTPQQVTVLTKIIGPHEFLIYTVMLDKDDVEELYKCFSSGLKRNFLNALSPGTINYIYQQLVTLWSGATHSPLDRTSYLKKILEECSNSGYYDRYSPLAELLTKGHDTSVYTEGKIVSLARCIPLIKDKGKALSDWFSSPSANLLEKKRVNLNSANWSALTHGGYLLTLDLLNNLTKVLDKLNTTGRNSVIDASVVTAINQYRDEKNNSVYHGAKTNLNGTKLSTSDVGVNPKQRSDTHLAAIYLTSKVIDSILLKSKSAGITPEHIIKEYTGTSGKFNVSYLPSYHTSSYYNSDFPRYRPHSSNYDASYQTHYF